VGCHDKCFSFVSELIQEFSPMAFTIFFVIKLFDFTNLFSHLYKGHSLICSAMMIRYSNPSSMRLPFVGCLGS